MVRCQGIAAVEWMTDFQDKLLLMLPRLRRFAMALSREPHEADDLVQATVERALRYADRWQRDTSMDSWLYRIAQNLWRDELRAHRRRVEPLDEAIEQMGDDGRESMLKSIQLDEVRAAMLQLPEEQKMVLVLVVLDGLSYREAAKVLEVPTGTVMSRLSRGRARLVVLLENGPEGILREQGMQR